MLARLLKVCANIEMSTDLYAEILLERAVSEIKGPAMEGCRFRERGNMKCFVEGNGQGHEPLTKVSL